jgi:hypothetical protein
MTYNLSLHLLYNSSIRLITYHYDKSTYNSMNSSISTCNSSFRPTSQARASTRHYDLQLAIIILLRGVDLSSVRHCLSSQTQNIIYSKKLKITYSSLPFFLGQFFFFLFWSLPRIFTLLYKDVEKNIVTINNYYYKHLIDGF